MGLSLVCFKGKIGVFFFLGNRVCRAFVLDYLIVEVLKGLRTTRSRSCIDWTSIKSCVILFLSKPLVL